MTSDPARNSGILEKAIFICLIVVVVGPSLSIALHSIAFGLALILWAAKMLIDRRWGLRATPLDYFFLAYAAAEILATVFSPHVWQSLVNMKRLLLIAIVYLTAETLTDEKKVLSILGTLFAVTAVLSLLEIADLILMHHNRLFMFQHYMTTGGIKMIVLLLMLPPILDRSTTRKIRLLLIAAFVPIFLALVLTLTRSSWLGFLCGAVVIGMIRSRTFVLAIVAFAVLFVLFAPDKLQQRATSVVNVHDPSNNLRIRMWETGWRIFLDHPIVGIGDTDVKQTYIQYTTPIDPNEGGHLHNNFVMLAVTLGTVGLCAVVAIFLRIITYDIAVFRRLSASPFLRNAVLGAIAVFIGFQVNGLFEWNFGDQEIITLFWFTAGLALAASRIAKVERKPAR